jgi:hypothetical protein
VLLFSLPRFSGCHFNPRQHNPSPPLFAGSRDSDPDMSRQNRVEVGVTSSRGLSPPSDRPCRAYKTRTLRPQGSRQVVMGKGGCPEAVYQPAVAAPPPMILTNVAPGLVEFLDEKTPKIFPDADIVETV